MQDTLNRILGAIEDTKLTLIQEIRKVSAELSHLRMDHHRVKDTETALEELQPAHQALRSQVTQLTERILKLDYRTKDAEGRSQRNNVRLVGMPEGVEGPISSPGS
ncbi:hypothetical protein NDU88_001090 [Pleurodeles waltl]|uniref:Uncharacterized protein n=1 Tax=Pleurodeles waltl TaxID=8319 RepID=A0AAV7U5J5_PLEWA|nr:hypothetical protein NDU88_001090 [Pleurodeles waltl]